MKKTVAMVPIKLNNERLPNKNIKILGNKPLIQYILDTLKSVTEIDEIYVFCSDESILKYLPEKVKFLKRSPELDLPTANFTQFFDAFQQIIDADIYVFTHATAPFVSKETFELCIDKVKNENYDSAFSASRIQDFLWQDGKPLNFNAADLPRTQDLTPIYKETSGVYVFKKSVFVETKRRIGNNTYIAEVPWFEAVDINTKEDFDFAEITIEIMKRNTEFNLIFDFDGVVINSENVQKYAFNESYKKAVDDENCPEFSEYMKYTGDSLPNIFKKMNLPLEMVDYYRKFSSEAIDKIEINKELIYFLKQLKNDYPKVKYAICTGKDRKRTIEILNYYNLTNLFDAIVCSDDVDNPKPSSEPTIKAMNELNGNINNTLLIGDGYYDILSAKNAKVKSVLTLWYGDNNVMRVSNYLSHNIDDFKEIICELFKI